MLLAIITSVKTFSLLWYTVCWIKSTGAKADMTTYNWAKDELYKQELLLSKLEQNWKYMHRTFFKSLTFLIPILGTVTSILEKCQWQKEINDVTNYDVSIKLIYKAKNWQLNIYSLLLLSVNLAVFFQLNT